MAATFILGIFLVCLAGSESALSVVIQPQHFNVLTKELNISCVVNEPQKTIFSIQIMRHIEDKPIASVNVKQDLKMATGLKDNVKAQGHIDSESNNSYLTLILDHPDRQDAGTYRCQMFYINEDFQMVEKNVIGNVTYQEQEITRVVTHLARKLSGLLTRVLLQNKTLQTYSKQHTTFKDIHSKQGQNFDILTQKIDTENNKNTEQNKELDRQDALINKLAKQIDKQNIIIDKINKDNTKKTKQLDVLLDFIRQQNKTIQIHERKQTCPNGWALYQADKQCLKAFGLGKQESGNHVSWSKARENCQGLGGDLVQIRDEYKKNVVLGLFNGAYYIIYPWIGVKNHAVHGFNFKYVDGSNLGSYHPWQGSEPDGNGDSNEKCVAMSTSSYNAGQWYDTSCTYKRPYVCSIPSKSVI